MCLYLPIISEAQEGSAHELSQNELSIPIVRTSFSFMIQRPIVSTTPTGLAYYHRFKNRHWIGTSIQYEKRFVESKPSRVSQSYGLNWRKLGCIIESR